MPNNFALVFIILMVVRQISLRLGKCMFSDTYKIRNAIEIC